MPLATAPEAAVGCHLDADDSVDFLKMLCGPACAVPATTLIKTVATDAMSDKVD
jgi:hypothetical protein